METLFVENNNPHHIRSSKVFNWGEVANITSGKTQVRSEDNFFKMCPGIDMHKLLSKYIQDPTTF